MYITDSAYMNLIKSGDRTSHVTGYIRTTRNNRIEINDGILVSDTLSVTNQSLDDTSFVFGTVYAAEASLTIITDVDRYELYDGYLTLTVHIGAYDIPLGEYTITEAYRVGKKVSIKACDAMLDFDVSITENTSGTAWELLSYACKVCNVQVGITKAQIEAMPNGANRYSVDIERVKTYRELISYIATVTCSFATIDRLGRLTLRRYATSSSFDVENTDRLAGAEFGDFLVRFKGVTGRFFANENFYPYSKEDATASGLTLNLGDIPIVTGNEKAKQAIVDAVWEYVKDMRYATCNMSIKPNPAFDLGDSFTNKSINNTAGVEAVCFVHYFQWNYRRPMVLKSMGDNPRLAAAKSQQGRSFSNLEASVAASKTIVQTYTNAAKLSIGSDDKELITMSYAPVVDCKPVFECTIQYELSADAVVTLKYYLNNVLIEARTVKRKGIKGPDFATLVCTFDLEGNTRNTFKVKASVAGVDDSTAKMTIAAGGAIAVSYAQGLGQSVPEWDGTLDLKDELASVEALSPNVQGFTANVGVV